MRNPFRKRWAVVAYSNTGRGRMVYTEHWTRAGAVRLIAVSSIFRGLVDGPCPFMVERIP